MALADFKETPLAAVAKFRKDRDAWYVFLNVGKKRRAWKVGPQGSESEAKARELADSINAARDAETQTPLALAGSAPFDQVAEAWLKASYPRMPDTVRRAKGTAVRRLVRAIGSRDIRTFDRNFILGVAGRWAEAGHVRSTLRTSAQDLTGIVAWAVENGIVARHPFDGARKGINGIVAEVAKARCAPDRRAQAWTRDELNAILDAAQARKREFYDLLLFAASTGARRGEIMALEWEDVNLEAGLATIRQSRTLEQITGGKTNAVRTVRLAPAVLEMLHARAELPRVFPNVFTNRRKRVWSARAIEVRWDKLRAKLSGEVRPLKFHCFRHTWASLALASGEDVAWCAGQLGHSVKVFLQTYAHLIQGTERSMSFLDFIRRPTAAPQRRRARSQETAQVLHLR